MDHAFKIVAFFLFEMSTINSQQKKIAEFPFSTTQEISIKTAKEKECRDLNKVCVKQNSINYFQRIKVNQVWMMTKGEKE